MLKKESINELITKQNYENIAKQSFSFQGINANIKEYNSLLKSSVKESNAFAEVVASHNMKLGNYLTSLNGANAGLGGYIKSLGIAKLKTIALSIATTALNMVIGAIASAIASFIIKGVTNIINSAENMKKAVDDMVTSYNDSLKTLESHKKTINDIKDDYATLSKGVDELGNNVSLTTDEYKKYQDICNQIADIYPSLIAGHTSEGNAILTLKGNVEALTKAYKDEQKAAAASVISGSDKENTNVVKNYKNESKTGIKNAFKSAFTFNSDKSMVNGLSTSQKISYLERATNLSIKDLRNYSGSIGSDNVFRSLLKTYGLDTDSTDQEVTTIIQNMKADLATYQAEVDEAMKGIKTKANAYFVYNSDYDNLNDEQINQISSLIDNALTEAVADTFNKDSDINSKFVQKIIDGIENNKEGISNAYKSLLAIDPNNMGDVSKDKQAIDDYIKKIADYIGTDAESLKKGLGYDVADDISQQYNNIIEEATKKSKEEAIKDAEQNLQDEYDKISLSEFNLGKYKDQIKNGTLPSQYGNVDMDNRQIIEWNIENIEKWKDALQDIQYYDDDGNFIDSYYDQLKESAENGYSSIDTVFGDMMDHIEGYGDITALAFSHIVNNDDGTFEFLGQKTAEEYLYGILDVAKQDGDMSIDHILELDKNGIQNAQVYNSQGEQIGETYIHGIISGFNDNADDVSKLTHFAGKYGAVQIAQDAIEEAKKKEPDFDWDSWFKEHSVNTQEEIDKWKEIASSANSAAEARENYAKQANTFKETKLFDMGSDNAPSTLSKLNSQLDEIQSAYSTLSSAVSEYNSNGNISIDTMQSVIALGDNWLDYIDMESGAFTLDQKALDKLTQARIEDMKQQALANLASTGLYSAIIDDQAMLDGTISEEESDNILNGISDEVERANSALARLNEIKNSYVNQISDNASWQSLGKDSSSSSSSKDTKEKFNWIEPLIKRISTAYSRLKNVVSDTTTTWLNRNNALSDSMSTLADEINAQSQAYEYYTNAFNSYGLDDYYKNQIANGSISIDVIYDEDLKNAISDCQDFYDKAQDAKTAVQELGIELKGLAKSRFDNLKSQYEEQINQITKTNDLLQKEADIIDTKGWFASTLLNNSFIEQEQKNLDKLKEERTALVNALNSAIDSGKIEEYSEDWYDMQSSIDDCTSSILDAEKALIEYDNAIRQINWDAFDRTRDDVEDLINETDFLVELLKDVGITDDDGNMTKEGQAAQALLAQKYQLYLNQAKAYKDEISKINEDLANDPYDKELLDRKQDLIDKEQEAIKSAMSEKDAIKDLTNDAYTDFIDKLGDAIDKYKELMDTMKDAYDYEKSIREKTEALNALEKQYSAYQGDNSEEGKKNIQQLKDQINTAKDNLKDTEYEKLISDTEKILDDLKDDVQSWVDQRLDQLDDLIQDIIEQSNENASDISQTINSTAENYGYNLSKPLLFSAKNVNYGKFN